MKKSGWSNKTKAMRIVGTKQLKDGGGVGDINQVKIEIEPQYYDEKNNRKNVALKYDVNFIIPLIFLKYKNIKILKINHLYLK